ncbi:PTN12-like protein [Mya arenaria]|uniref:protein-tyrosine-phosphatase n=1 Tax=Mya arenaria TaxID=6604 RepID=A0ABY7FTC5_MYAAR|nr:PTN12-like protein [Mya arenaria]
MEPADIEESTRKLEECLNTFIDHVEKLRNEDDPSGDGFTREFRIWCWRTFESWACSTGKKIRSHQRRGESHDEYRVRLNEIPGDEGSDYINASFIQDQFGTDCYIASQGPVEKTVNDFWRMILQYKVKVIAMACKLVEAGRKKCEQYWPDLKGKTEEFGDISVTLISEDEMEVNCMIRKLEASQAGGPPVTVTQFHYTGWPDHGIPNDFDVILEMMAEMREIKRNDPDKAPMVVHCSAGCGRTGTICAIDYAWDVLKTGKMDRSFCLNTLVKQMREQRPSMIQTHEQYMMAHVTVQTLFQKHLDLMEDHVYGNIDFGEQEDSEDARPRKSSVLTQDIESTVKNITHPPEMSLKESEDDMLHLPAPLAPIQAPGSHPNPVAVQEHLPTSPKPALPKKPMDVGPAISSGPFNKEAEREKPEGGGMRRENQRSFKVEKIQNIPSQKDDPKVEMRYLGSINKEENSQEKHLSFPPSETGKQDLQSRKQMFEKPDTGKPEPMTQKPKLSPKNSVDRNSNSVIYPGPTLHKQNTLPSASASDNNKSSIKKTQSVDQSGAGSPMFKTVLTVGGEASKTGLLKTKSAPGPPAASGSTMGLKKTNTLPAKAFNPFIDQPQSSVSPDTTVTKNDVYSLARDRNDYSAVSNYSSGVSSTQSTMQSTSAKPYSDLANYSSLGSAENNNRPQVANSGRIHSGSTGSNPYSYAADSVASSPGQPQPKPAGTEYSYAQEITDNVYAEVDRSNNTHTQKPKLGDAVYESVDYSPDQMGKTGPPPIPDRNYQDDEQTSTPQDSTNTTDVPGFGKRIGKKPKGKKDQPKAWKKT